MEINHEPLNKEYEVEKIITCKFYKNKKYYLIKWLCYPITESTWEPKSSIKHLSSLLQKFEDEYPYSIDKEMYEIYCEELKKKKKKRKNKKQKHKEIQNETKLLSKKKKLECFSESELKDIYYDKLKSHLYINILKRHFNKLEKELIIDLSSSTTSQSEDNNSNFQNEKENETKEKDDSNRLIMPIFE